MSDQVAHPPTVHSRSEEPHRWWRLLGGAALLGLLIAHVGLGPFAAGLRATTPWAVAVALAVTAGTTWCCARRWSLVAGWFGERVPIRVGYPAYYRSQLINVAVPGGVVGDVHRGWRFGWRPVLWERIVGQAVQLGLVGALVLPGSWRWVGLAALAVVVAAGGAVAVLSVLSTSGHLLVFLAACVAAGAPLPVGALVSIGALVLLGASVPFHVLGWGPREGVAALAFPAYGASAADGVSVAVTFGVLTVAATLPGLWTLWSHHG